MKINCWLRTHPQLVIGVLTSAEDTMVPVRVYRTDLGRHSVVYRVARTRWVWIAVVPFVALKIAVSYHVGRHRPPK